MASPATTTLLDHALASATGDSAGGIYGGRVVLVEDCVDASGAFVLHHLLKRAFSGGGAVLFVALAYPFSHYDRIMKKLGCNLAVHRDKNRFFFFDASKIENPGGIMGLYGKLHKTAYSTGFSAGPIHITIIVDDVSLLELAAYGDAGNVLDFLHYCRILTVEQDGSLIMLNHGDIYSSSTEQRFISQLKYMADVIIKVGPLATGVAADVHGQLTVLNKKIVDDQRQLVNKIHSFHFRVKENSVEYFPRGTVGK